MDNRRTFPIDQESPYAVKEMAEFLESGGRLVLFAEGRITCTGALMKLFEGTGFLLQKTGAKLVLGHIRGAHRLRFSRQKGWTRLFHPVSLHFRPAGERPDFTGANASSSRELVTQWVMDEMMALQFEAEMEEGAADLLTAIIESATKTPGKVVLEDIKAAR